jgi:site-specific DNA-methyltransferase (adenine-specific)
MINMLQGDCMELMAKTPDKYYELAIVDPPYGIGDWTSSVNVYTSSSGKIRREKRNDKKKVSWNESYPDINYYNELIRVSQNQIIWGANYYNSFSDLGGAVIWYKGNINPVFSQCEIASLSFQKRVDYVNIDWQAGFARRKEGETIHPCQKPVELYKWLLSRYAKPGDRILDTHGGSGSICIACHDLGFDLDWIELDEDYYRAAVERYKRHAAQNELFEFSGGMINEVVVE